MTRKALRKRLRRQTRQASRAHARQTHLAAAARGTSPWMTVGVLVASAALTTAHSTTASAAEVDRRGGGYPAGRRQQLTRSLGSLPRSLDPRLDTIHEVLTPSAWSLLGRRIIRRRCS